LKVPDKVSNYIKDETRNENIIKINNDHKQNYKDADESFNSKPIQKDIIYNFTNEKNVVNILINKKLDSIKFRNPFLLFLAKPIKSFDNYPYNINGNYLGELVHEKGENGGRTDDVSLKINFQKIKNKLKGNFFLELSDDGIVYSSKKGNGDNNSIRIFKKNTKEIILVASPDSFLQITYIKKNDYFIGNYYKNNKYTGKVRLFRE